MSAFQCIEFYVSGKVQGVWFRACTKEEAQSRDITGFVENLPDGRVRVIACGEKEKIEQLYMWLKKGPPQASVIEVTREELPTAYFSTFEVRYNDNLDF